MASTIVKDLEMDKDLDNISMLQIIDGHGCHPPRKVCFRRRIKYLKKVTYYQKKITYVKKYKFVPAYKTVTVCFWR